VFFLSDVFDLAQSTTFDEGAFQVYQTLGGLMVANATDLGTSNDSTLELAHELRNRLDDFNPSWQLSSGLSMEVLWTVFRPSVPENLEQLEACLQVERLADHFDVLRLTSGAPFKQILSLGQSLADMYRGLKPMDIQLDDQLEVSKHSLTAHEIHSSSSGHTQRYPGSGKPLNRRCSQRRIVFL